MHSSRIRSGLHFWERYTLSPGYTLSPFGYTLPPLGIPSAHLRKDMVPGIHFTREPFFELLLRRIAGLKGLLPNIFTEKSHKKRNHFFTFSLLDEWYSCQACPNISIFYYVSSIFFRSTLLLIVLPDISRKIVVYFHENTIKFFI